jgi:UDP-glucose:(heptosyl)LPS alpha-1,3-glucosyltransferase
MRIALVLDRYDPGRGGLEHWADELVRWLVGRGHGVDVVAFDAQAAAIPAGVTLHLVASRPGHLERAAAAARDLEELTVDVVHDLGVGWRYDVLQAQGGCKLASARRSARSLTPWRRVLRTLDPRYRRRIAALRRLESRQYAAAGGLVVSVSRFVQRELTRRWRIAPERLRVVHNGVDLMRFSPCSDPDARRSLRRRLGVGDRVVFLMAARNYRLKGAGTALRALRVLERRDGSHAHLVVIGNESDATFARVARRLGVADRVTFCGRVDDQVPYVHAADVLLHPTFYDACSLALLEGWACGLPVIASAFDGAAELMNTATEGIVLEDPGDAGELAEAMAVMLDPAVRERMGGRARELAERHPQTASFEEIERLYLEAAAARRSAACRR